MSGTRHSVLHWISGPVWVILGMLAGGGMVQAQEQAGDLVYRFAVDGVHDPAAAKPLQVALMEEEADVSLCLYVDACACLKLVTTRWMDREQLGALLQAHGHVLSGAVMVSDGRVLPPPQPLPHDR